MKKFLLIAILLIISIYLVGCVEEYTYTDVQGVVIDKEYDEAHSYLKTTTDSDGNKKSKRVYEDEEYEVVIRYEDIEKEFEFEDDSFYNEVEIGDKVKVTLEEGLNEEGAVLTRDIELSGQ